MFSSASIGVHPSAPLRTGSAVRTGWALSVRSCRLRPVALRLPRFARNDMKNRNSRKKRKRAKERKGQEAGQPRRVVPFSRFPSFLSALLSGLLSDAQNLDGTSMGWASALSSLAGLTLLLALSPRDEPLGYDLSPAGLGWCSDKEFLNYFRFLHNIRDSRSVFLRDGARRRRWLPLE